MLVEAYPVRSCRFVLRKYRLCLAGRIRTPDGNGRHRPVIIGIVFQKAVDLVLRPFGKDIRHREVVRDLYLADMYLKPFRIRVYSESGIFQDIVPAFQHFVYRRPFRRGLEMRCLFQFELVGHVLALDFQRAV